MEILDYHLDTAKMLNLTHHLGDAWWSIGSPISNQILYVAQQNNLWDVFSMNDEGTSPVNLTIDGFQEWHPPFQP